MDAISALQTPYKGADSYQTEDALFFFGRDDEADLLMSRILSQRFTLLHAPSGAGKSSLLNATILPKLEKRGWIPILARPDNNPLRSIRISTLQYIAPPPEAELQALRRARKGLVLPPTATLHELLNRYDFEVQARDPIKRLLVSPIVLHDGIEGHDLSLAPRSPTRDGQLFPAGAKIVPYVCRLLRSSLELGAINEQLCFLHHVTSPTTPSPILLLSTPLGDIEAYLAHLSQASGFDAAMHELDIPVPSLWAFFENLTDTYGSYRSAFSLVLILDQFEEIFTRFIDKGIGVAKKDLPSYKLKHRLFRELNELYHRPLYVSEDPAVATVHLPLRLVISMRDEYIAELGPVKSMVGTLEPRAFRLNWLGKAEARLAINAPARLYGCAFSQDASDRIVNDLAREGLFIQPAHLQVVCERLWKHRDAEPQADSPGAEQAGAPAISAHIDGDALTRLGGVEGILASFFEEFLDEKLASEAQHWEALLMLESLITPGGTRNIVSYDELVHQELHDAWEREAILALLVEGRLLRLEQRLGSNFFEITHEFLIGPILNRMRQESRLNPDYNDFREALRVLQDRRHRNYRVGVKNLLSRRHFALLHRRKEHISWTDWAIELMYRSAFLHLNNLGDDHSQQSVITYWSNRYQHSGTTVAAILRERMPQMMESGLTLSLEELYSLDQAYDTHEALSYGEIEHVFISLLCEANTDEHPQLAKWASMLNAAYASS